MNEEKIYDAAIVGGGLSGLSAAILLAKNNHSVILFEKESYPFHKVCGEYISLESWDFVIKELGLDLNAMNLPIMKDLWVTSPNGNSFRSALPLGGFGISRFLFDNELKKTAIAAGVEIKDGCKVENINFLDEIFSVKTPAGSIKSKVCCAAYGKRSNIDVQLARPFIKEKNDRLNNYIGVKYHITSSLPVNEISLHNFKDGYCGISKIENDQYCLCYLTKAGNLKKSGNVIGRMEKEILYKNPALKEIFEISTKTNSRPISISQISFSNKSRVENHMLMIGDAGGMITPLCGNGMSIAFHTGKLAAAAVSNFLVNKFSRHQMEDNYEKNWKINFSRRLKTGRAVQYFFGKALLTNLLIQLMKINGSFAQKIIRLTHGKPF